MVGGSKAAKKLLCPAKLGKEKEKDQENRTEVDKTSPFLLQVLCSSSHGTTDVWWCVQPGVGWEGPGQGLLMEYAVDSVASLCWVLLGPLCSLGTAVSSVPRPLTWKGCEAGLILFFVLGCPLASLHDIMSRGPWCCGAAGCSASRDTHFLPTLLCSQMTLQSGKMWS